MDVNQRERPMTNSMNLILAGAVAAVLGGATAATADTEPESTAVSEAAEPSWPPVGCPDPATLKTWLKTSANRKNMVYIGFYTDGYSFWVGTDHGRNIFPPDVPFQVPADKQPYVMRWNISGSPPGGKSISSYYRLDNDPQRDGDYAVSTLAINVCETDNRGDYGDCDQPIFGEDAWRDDADFCPPIIISEDPDSVYLWDPNQPRGLPQVYDYSLSLILKSKGPNDKKGGIRLIIDPKVRNSDEN